MPKRSNDFQKLVEMVQRALAPENATVTESAEVEGLDGGFREIDVLIEAVAGPYKIKIAVEAKDHGRKMDIVQFEQLVGKYNSHSGVLVDKKVVVTKNGFLKPVRRRAKHEGFVLFTLNAINEESLGRALNPNPLTKWNFGAGPHIHCVKLELADFVGEIPEALRDGRVICPCHGMDQGSISDQLNHYVRCRLLPKIDIKEECKKYPDGLCITSEWPPHGFKLRLAGADYQILKLAFKVNVLSVQVEAKATVVEMKGDGYCSRMDHISGEVFGKKFNVLFPKGRQSKRIIVDLPIAEMLQKAIPFVRIEPVKKAP